VGRPRHSSTIITNDRAAGGAILKVVTSRVVLFALGVAVLSAQSLPRIEGETLSGKKVSLPDGTPALLIIGFTHGSQAQTKAWSQRVHNRFDTWSISVLEDVPRLMRGMVSHSIKGSIAREQHDRFLLVYHGEKELKQAAGFDRPEDAYVLAIDGSGAIQWRFHGPVTDAAVEQAAAALKK
jgi:hypothetical protein